MALTNTVTESDLLEFHPQLADQTWPESADFTTMIEAAFQILSRDLSNMGWNPARIVESDECFKPLIRLKTLALVFSDLRRQEGDRWDLLARDAESQYRREIRRVRFDYDRDGDGVVSSSDTDLQAGLELRR